MDFLKIVLIFIISFIVGNFGFCQIIGCIKFSKTVKNKALPIILWALLIFLCAFIVFRYFNEQKIALIIAYIISFILSLNVKPDAEQPELSYKKQFTEQQESTSKEQYIKNLEDTYNKAVEDLGDLTIEDAKKLYAENKITAEYRDQLINAIDSLNFIISTYPALIEKAKEMN